ncbi:hypothetical protein [Prauserella muralis]|nr:hypothetical protein [Prauserella muralis]TWE13820.1 hypothetical protein FHX69_5949 [Prauserella muralis]
MNPREENDEPAPKQPYHSKKVLPGPEGGGPPLEWHYGDRRMQWWFSGVTVVACLLLAVFKSGWAWAGEWYVWAVLAAFGLIAWILPKGHKISAGADWLNTRGEIVRIYELTAVKLKGTAGGYNIHLYDVHGHEADTGLDLMYANRDLWDLVYNGIRHSVAHGAQTDALTRSKLQLGREHHEQDSGS